MSVVTMLILALSFLLFVLVYALNKKVDMRFNPASTMMYLWVALIVLASLFGDELGFYPLGISCVSFVFLFLFIIIITTLALTERRSKETTRRNPDSIRMMDERTISRVSCAFFFFYCVCNFFYFRDLSKYIPLSSLLSSLWRWKNLVLTGVFSEDSFLYLGRNLSFIGSIVAINFIRNKKSKVLLRRVTAWIMFAVYFAITLINPRRDPMIDKMVYLMVPFIYTYGRSLKKIFKIGIPLVVSFFAIFLYIAEAMSFGNFNVLEMLGRYTFAPFNSLQKTLDYGYRSNTDLLMGNTFYFVYMVLKYAVPNLAPPSFILEGLGSDTGNIYTSIIAPYIDADGSFLLFTVLLLIYGIYIGVIIAISINLLKKGSLASFTFYAAVFACAVRSFYNPTFSAAEVPFAVVYAVLLTIILPRVNSHNRKRLKV